MPPNPKTADFTMLAVALAAALISLWYVATHPLPLIRQVEAAQESNETSSTPITMYAVKEILEEIPVTGYNSVSGQTDARPCESADGSDICALEARGDHSCASNDFSFGTRLYITGLGLCTVRDRMASRFARRVDWYFGDESKVKDARDWGVQRRTIYVLEK